MNPEDVRRERNDREREGESSSPYFSLNNPKTTELSVGTNWSNRSEELKVRKKDETLMNDDGRAHLHRPDDPENRFTVTESDSI